VVVVDWHVHLYSAAVRADPAGWAAARGERRWVEMVAPREDGRSLQGWADEDRLLRDMDAAGIERAVLQGWYWQGMRAAEEQNRFYAGCVRRRPDRLSAMATIHPAAGEAALEELVRAREDGLVGLGELSPHAQGFRLDDPVWQEALARAAAWGWPVTLHVTEPAGRDYVGRVETPLRDFQRLARGHPQVRFVLAHWGGLLPLFALNAAVAADLGNVWYDTAAWPLLYGAEVAKAVVAVVGAGRVLLGSDYPLMDRPRRMNAPSFGPTLSRLAAAELDEEARARIAGANALALLAGVDPKST
jgi:predicted TIM-barrel fold metal-dependent hydrolase